MSNIDKQAVQAVSDLKAGYTLGHADVAILNKLARIALASLEADPVAYWRHAYRADGFCYADGINSKKRHEASPLSQLSDGDYWKVTPLYTAPPAPVSVHDERYQHLSELYHAQEKRLFKLSQRINGPSFDKYAHSPSQAIDVLESALFGESADACRAAMLQGADGKPELTVWYGAMPETNGKTNWTAILHRKGECLSTGITIDRSEYPERVRYEADRMLHLIGELADEPDILAYDADAHSGYVEPVTTAYKLPDDFDFDRFNDVTWLDAVASNPHMHSLTTSTIAMVALELNKRLEAGNSLVIPDGWVACSERMPDIGTEIFYFCQGDGLRDCGIVSSSNFSGRGDAQLYVHADGYDLRFGVDITHWMPLPAAPQQEVK